VRPALQLDVLRDRDLVVVLLLVVPGRTRRHDVILAEADEPNGVRSSFAKSTFAGEWRCRFANAIVRSTLVAAGTQ
jgi:hypothetical protein